MVTNVLLVLIAGFCAGFLNVTAGGGSLFSIPTLLLIGLPPHVTIGTNRAAVTFHALAGLLKYRREGALTLTPLLAIAPPALIGSILGAQIVLSIEEYVVEYIISGALTLVFLCFLLCPQFGFEEGAPRTSGLWACPPEPRLQGRRWARPPELRHRGRRWVTAIAAFILGVYGGFLGIGVSTFFIVLLILSSGFTFVRATAATQVPVFLLSFTATLVFAYESAIDYLLALPLALSMAAGAYIGAALVVRFGNRWVHTIFLLTILALILSLLGVQGALAWILRSLFE